MRFSAGRLVLDGSDLFTVKFKGSSNIGAINNSQIDSLILLELYQNYVQWIIIDMFIELRNLSESGRQVGRSLIELVVPRLIYIE